MSGFRGVVLCGGASRRMGRDKAFIEVAGRPMVVIAVEALLGAGAQSVRCLGGDEARLCRLGLHYQPDRFPGQGPLGALLSAFEPVQPADQVLPAEHIESTELVMVLTCDLPLVDAAVVRAVVAALQAQPDAAIAAPLVENQVQFLSAAYRPGLVLDPIRDAFAAGVRAVRIGLVGVPLINVEGLDASRLVDADTPAALAQLRQPGPGPAPTPACATPASILPRE